MGKFEIGQKVTVVDSEPELNGEVGIVCEINSYSTALWEYEVEMVSGDKMGFDARELAPAAPPAPESAPGGEDYAVQMSAALDRVTTESVMLMMELAEALGLHRHEFLDADGGDAVVEAVANLRTELAVERAAHNVNAQRMNEFEAELAAAREREAGLRAALESIANSQFCNYSGITEYSKGVTDGHRYCAQIARDTLQTASANGGAES